MNTEKPQFRFVAIGSRVMYGSKAICAAASSTMAKRIAAALNQHRPNKRGV